MLHKIKQKKRSYQLQIQRKKKDRFPDLTLYTQYQSMWMHPEQRWWVGVSMNLPIWQGTRHAEIQQLEQKIKAIDHQILSQMNHIHTQLHQTYLVWQQNLTIIKQDQKTLLPLNQHHLQQMQKLYEQEQLTLHEWIQLAQQQQDLWWQHQQTLIQAMIAYARLHQWMDLYHQGTLKEYIRRSLP